MSDLSPGIILIGTMCIVGVARGWMAWADASDHYHSTALVPTKHNDYSSHLPPNLRETIGAKNVKHEHVKKLAS